MKSLVRELPPIHELQHDFIHNDHASAFSKERLTQVIQQEVDDLRNKLLTETYAGKSRTREEFRRDILKRLEEKALTMLTPNLRPVINATGVVLHTNLGRARLSEQAIEGLTTVARSYNTLEYDLSSGKRGSRHDIAETLICEATGAEAAMVVNNNAAAVYLVLRALANDREVIVSRGELVEIGGSFRVSSIMSESGAQLREVGTTNKTHLYDYEDAVTEDTSMIMKVHRSNFSIVGFTSEVDRKDLSRFASDQAVIYYEDLGSGALFDYRKQGIGSEPTVQSVLMDGADIVSFSGDKLLGGPQAGIIAGKKSLIDKLKKNQLARVLRVDKLTLSALEATLQQHVVGEENTIPAVRDILLTKEEVFERATTFCRHLLNETSFYDTEIVEDVSQVGGGTMPEVELDTYVVMLSSSVYSCNELETKLRQAPLPVITRIKEDRIILDLRTVSTEEEGSIIQALNAISQ
ncbi:L-seryl-tRNA(Sec) selenium transferase [Guptibacillus algicola]|uniref:L-seryl-tRNA(Sec) selenium transferase n=1 Tax=Guptibacillus algicola TaxID=225844 RepID=UPI001CD20106|nr:L-seryl-tRNA(Sec) selenium transferase [Alkalihalobacillus algicola]MCA0988159.1 L-seryl-tRNA(Sec) selenium transferase [Alkalihalobacillus algicola]